MAKDKARTFGQDLMRGEHAVGGGTMASKKLDGVLMTSLTAHPDYYKRKTKAEDELGRKLTNEEFENDYWIEPSTDFTSGTSIFDPVLTELMYQWFCPIDGVILDPFAGGSVRGVVAGVLGRKYIGVDLRPEQIEANIKQAHDICPDNLPHWIVGNSLNIVSLVDTKADFLFSCPPYYDLEVYSDDPDDLSTKGTYQDFLIDYKDIIKKSLSLLKDDSFACFVVGDIRDKKGFYCNFVGDTITAFLDAGAKLYNEAILVTVAGSLPIRVGRQFTAGRKLGKTHQNVLVFCKGDPKKATEKLGEVDFGLLDNKLPNGVEEL